MGLLDFLKKNIGSQKPSFNQVNVSFTTNVDDTIPVSKRIAGMEPQCNGLYPHEVLMLSYQKQLNMTDEQLLDFIKQSMSRIQNGLAPFIADEAFEIVKAKMTGDESTLPKIYSNARSRFRKTYNIKKR